MTGGSNDRDDDGTQRNPEWWEGTPEPGSPWQSQPRHPEQPGDPTTPAGYGTPGGYGGYPPYPLGSELHQSGPVPYQPAPFPPGRYGPPSGGGRKGLLFAGIGVLVLALVTVAAVILVNRDSEEPVVASTTTTSAAQPTTTTRTTRTTTGPTSPSPVIPGYQVISPTDIDAAWDVPRDWVLDESIKEFSSADESVPVSGLTTEGAGYCTDFVRTNMFLSATTNPEATASAREIGEKLARIGWSTGSGITSTPGEPFTNTDGSLQGVFMETTGTFTAPDPRCADTFTVYTFAVSGGATSSIVLTIAADTGVDRAIDPTFARRLLATLRLV
ncbi:hypothetical protein [Nocardia sp. CC227C]|uniref:hypothetical protein n=1 Tax=Nocardia sp. CC227C TaxID=3044562 RepID=UPI00278C491C|nr:hypothetical protein [Nocardia sp. CC227C]